MAEPGLTEVAEQSSSFEAIIVRPGGILRNDSVLARKVLPVLVPVVLVSKLAQAMVEAASGGPSKMLLQNQDIIELGRGRQATDAKVDTNDAAKGPSEKIAVLILTNSNLGVYERNP